MKNCLSCSRFLKCSDPAKGRHHICSKWQVLQELDSFKKSGVLDPPPLTKSEDDQEMFHNFISALSADNLPIVGDPRLDDRDHPLALNWADWFMNRNMLGIMPFQKHLEIGLHLFNDVCPRCSPEFYEPDTHYSHKMRPEVFLSKVQLFEHGVCPECNYNRERGVRNKRFTDKSGLIMVAGQRSSKSILTAKLATYTMHRYLKLRNPAAYFRLLKATVLHGTFTANTFAQAKESLMDPLLSMVSNSPWFQNYHEWLNDRGRVLGEELYKVRDSFLYYRHAALNFAVSSPSKRNLRGRTRFFTSIDELGWFSQNEDAIKASGAEVHEALSRSLQTVRSAARELRRSGRIDVPFPLSADISSPSDINDPIMSLYRAYKNSDMYYRVHAPTWKINPKISKSDLKEFFDANHDKADRDFGANPPMSSVAFVDKEDSFYGVVDKKRRNAVVVSQKRVLIGPRKMPATVASASCRWSEPPEIGRLLTMDIGVSDNSFAFAVSHYDTESQKLVFDAFGEVIPTKRHPINIARVTKNLVLPIVEEMNVVAAISDHWQSKKLLDELEDAGVATATVRLPYSAFTAWREDGLIANTFSLPRTEMPIPDIKETTDDYRKAFLEKPVSHLIYQCLTVVDKMNKSVEKGPRLTDDLFRSCVLAYHVVSTDEEVKKLVSGVSDEEEMQDDRASIGKPGTNSFQEGIIAIAGKIKTEAAKADGSAEKGKTAMFSKAK